MTVKDRAMQAELNRQLVDLQTQIRAEQTRIGKISSATKHLAEAIQLLARPAKGADQ